MVRRSTAVVIGLFTLLLGILSGLFVSQLLPPRIQSTLADTVNVGVNPSPSEDTLTLLESALETAKALRDGDFALLSSYIHPTEGVTFTPNCTVDRAVNQTFTAGQIAKAGSSAEAYVWGTATDTAAPISLTFSDYLSGYVWDEDYLAAPRISVDSTSVTGNALENLTDAYPDCRYVEFYFPGADAQMDWSALRLVYQQLDSRWYLVGVIHSEWSA